MFGAESRTRSRGISLTMSGVVRRAISRGESRAMSNAVTRRESRAVSSGAVFNVVRRAVWSGENSHYLR